MEKVLFGTTLRFDVSFRDWQDNPVDPASQRIRFTDAWKNVSTFGLVRTTVGEYYADIPLTTQYFTSNRFYSVDVLAEIEIAPGTTLPVRENLILFLEEPEV